MLTCRACRTRCLQTLIGDCLSPLKSSIATDQNRQTIRRNYASVSTHKESREADSQHIGTSPSNYNPLVGGVAHKYDDPSGQVPISSNRKQWLESRGVRPVRKSQLESKPDFVIEKHLSYLKDPLKLAEFVRKSLRDDDFEGAEAIVRAASKDVLCTVSWNHLIDWQLNKGKMNAAIKTFNEMKKRTQIPDAQTYTIIFRGCAEHPEADNALAKVLTIYQSMLREKSPVKPNVIHMNAVIKMCARAQNMDALYTIAGQMPEKGIRAPNNLTYTTMINAIRISAATGARTDLTPMQKRNNIHKAILLARTMWEDITRRWRQGDMWIDEELVCAMGRLLLMGDQMDRDDIFSLVEQTMNIPRQVPRRKDRETVEPENQGRIRAGQEEGTESSTPDTQPDAISESLEVVPVDQFKSITPAKPPPTATAAYARPGHNSLSLLMKACLEESVKEPATKYWEIFRQAGVNPDQDNFHAYLRILRISRSSTETIQLLQQMRKEDMEQKTFRIAMSTCERDKNNRHAFSNAGKILDLMQTTLEVPSIPVLHSYMHVAVYSTAYSTKTSSSGPNDPSKRTQGRQILRALDRLNPSFLNLRSLLAYGDPTQPKMSQNSTAEFADQLIALIRRMISAYDLLMNQGLVDRSEYQTLTKQRSKLAAFVTRYNHLDGKVKPQPHRDTHYQFDKRAVSGWNDPNIRRRLAVAKHQRRNPDAESAVLDEITQDFAREGDAEKRDLSERRSLNFSTLNTVKFAEEEGQATKRVLEAALDEMKDEAESVPIRRIVGY